MTLENLIATVTNSSKEDWHSITCWGATSGPSYHNKFTFYDTYQGQDNVVLVEAHGKIAVFKDDVSITLAYGLTADEEYIAEWSQKFPDPQASTHYVDIFFNGALVYRDKYVSVDGNRAYLPVPKFSDDLQVELTSYALSRLVDSLDHGNEFERYFQRAGLQLNY